MRAETCCFLELVPLSRRPYERVILEKAGGMDKDGDGRACSLCRRLQVCSKEDFKEGIEEEHASVSSCQQESKQADFCTAILAA